MPDSVRSTTTRVGRELEKLKVVLNAAGMKFDVRNPMAKYSRVLDLDFLATNVMQKIKAELMEEIEIEMLKDPRTAVLIQGRGGKQISEKRRGGWKKVPKPDDGSHRNSPIKVDLKKNSNKELALMVKLNHPLYITMHSGTRPHEIRPHTGIHVFPTAEAIAKNPAWANTPYGPSSSVLKRIPWRDPNDKKIRFKIAYPAPIPSTLRSGPEFGRHGSTGYEKSHPFVTLAWRRVTRRIRSRYLRFLVQQVKQGGP